MATSCEPLEENLQAALMCKERQHSREAADVVDHSDNMLFLKTEIPKFISEHRRFPTKEEFSSLCEKHGADTYDEDKIVLWDDNVRVMISEWAKKAGQRHMNKKCCVPDTPGIDIPSYHVQENAGISPPTYTGISPPTYTAMDLPDDDFISMSWKDFVKSGGSKISALGFVSCINKQMIDNAFI